MSKKHIFFLICLFLGSYISFAQNVTIKGQVLNNEFSEVNLISSYQQNAAAVATTSINDKGEFTLKATIPSSDLYMLKFNEQKMFLLCLSPKENITLTLDAKNLQKVVDVKGSESIAYTKELTDLLTKRKACLDSINFELQKDKTQIYLSNYAASFKGFNQSFVDVQPDVISALQKCDSLTNLVVLSTKNGKVDKKFLDEFLTAAIANLKLMKNYYASYKNYLQVSTPAAYMTRSNNPLLKEFDQTVDTYMNALKEYNTLVPRTLSFYVENAENLVSDYDGALYDGKLESAKAKSEFANRIIDLVAQNTIKEKTASDIKDQANIISRLGGAIVTDAQRKIQDIVADYQREFNQADASIAQRVNELMLSHKTDLASLMFIDNFSQDKTLFGNVMNALNNAYPEHPLVKERYSKINNPNFRTAEGNIAPELEFESPSGKILKLSDLRGKVVLIDFWASWCGPCRRENPHVVSLYEKYHDKGFEIFSVSLDNSKDKWIEAIKKDNLSWPNHVSDLKGWSSAAAKLYGVNSIPCTFLIDKDGRIIAKSLRGDALSQKLQQIFGE